MALKRKLKQSDNTSNSVADLFMTWMTLDFRHIPTAFSVDVWQYVFLGNYDVQQGWTAGDSFEGFIKKY